MNIIPFNFGSNTIRTIDSDGVPMFVAKDVATLLGYSNTNDAIKRHCEEVVKCDLPTSSGIQSLSVIPEFDVYNLIIRSKMPEAKKFKDWVVKEVLPSIRKTGAYSAEPAFIVPKDLGSALRLAATLSDRLEEAQPALEFTKAVTESINAITVQDFAKLMGTGQNKLFSLLRTQGFLMAGGPNNNKPYQRFIDQELFELKEGIWRKDRIGEATTYFKTLITGKGQQYFQKKYFTQISA